jgi:hypothetical protein
VSHDVERVLADIDADQRRLHNWIAQTCACSLSSVPPRQLLSLTGLEHGRTILLAVICPRTELGALTLLESRAATHETVNGELRRF